ncbi:MAG: hypothetical protein IPN72_11620 [Saprospiraceae bacterium]|nr:hypothetical protein [Saprospiraceae bacterium]
MINTDTLELEKNLDEDEHDILSYAIPNVRERYNSIAPEVATSIEVVLPADMTNTVPQRGEKWKLIELSLKNLDYFISQKKRSGSYNTNKQTPAERY